MMKSGVGGTKLRKIFLNFIQFSNGIRKNEYLNAFVLQ